MRDLSARAQFLELYTIFWIQRMEVRVQPEAAGLRAGRPDGSGACPGPRSSGRAWLLWRSEPTRGEASPSQRRRRRGAEAARSELDGDAADDLVAKLVRRQLIVGRRAAAQLHVEEKRQVGGHVEQRSKILGEEDLQAVEGERRR